MSTLRLLILELKILVVEAAAKMSPYHFRGEKMSKKLNFENF